MSPQEWSIRHPYTVMAFYLGIAILSVWAIAAALPTRLMPYVRSPLVGVVTRYPGLSAEEMETYVSKPIEERMTDLRGVRFIRSVSQDGMSIVSVEFHYGWDMDKALFDVQQLMQIAQGDLPYDPANLKPSWVIPMDPLNRPVINLALNAPDWDTIKLREFADNVLVNRLKTVEGVESVVVKGGFKRQVQVIVDKDKLQAFGLSIVDVAQAMDQHNISPPAGRLTFEDTEARVRMDTRLQEVADALEWPIGRVGDRVIYLADVARIEDTFEERRSAFYYSGVLEGQDEPVVAMPALSVGVIQNPDGSSPRTIEGVNAELDRIKREYPGLHFTVAYDNGHYVEILLHNMAEELALAALLTGIVILLFLGDRRGVFISLVTIPMCLGWTLLMMVPLGRTLDSSTLVGLVLAIGRLVDDSIVDIHAVKRHLNMGKDPVRAAIDGTSEVRVSIISTTLIIILGLTPLLFCGGITELMFVGLVWPIVVALITSMIISLTLTPLMCAKMLRPDPPADRRGDILERSLLFPFRRLLHWVEARYAGALNVALGHRPFVVGAAACTVLVGYGFYRLLPYEMMPIADVGQAFGMLEMEPGTSFARTEQAAKEIQKIIMKRHPDVERVAVDVGGEPGGTYFTAYSMGLVNSASFLLTMSDIEERPRWKNAWYIVDGIAEEVLETVPGVRRFQLNTMGSDVMASSAAPIQVVLYGEDLETLDAIAQETARRSRESVDGLHQVNTTWSMGQPEYHIEIDRRRALELGLTPAKVARQAYVALWGSMTREFYNPPNIRHPTVLVRYEEDQRAGPDDLSLATITTPTGRQVPLDSVAQVVKHSGPTVIEHDQMRRTISVIAFYRRENPDDMGLASGVMGQAMAVGIPPGYGMEMRGDMTQMMDSFARILLGLKLGTLFIFLILVQQFRSFTKPFVMALAVPLVLTGAFGGLYVNGMAISTVSLLALIILVGMDFTVAVLLIDLIDRLREQGLSRREAILTGAPIRLEPILMTTITALIVLVPVAFLPKTGIDAWAPLAVAVVCGMVLALPFELFFIPVMYTLVEDGVTFLRRLVGRSPKDVETVDRAPS